MVRIYWNDSMAAIRRIFSGIQPSGTVHLGNYLGALRSWVRLQDECPDVLYSIVDLHALTVPQAPTILRENVRHIASCLLACGVDPERSVLFQQSAVSQHCELTWLLACRTPVGWLNKMTQWKAKGATDNRDVVNLGLFAYPVLMSADIMLYRATHVPVGEDQLQHLELARDIARSFNSSYSCQFFPEPQSLLGEVRRVMSLRNPLQKMSKSDNVEMGRINLNDCPDDIRKKVRKAVTDHTSAVTYDPVNRPGVSNLVSIYSAITGAPPENVCEQMKDLQTVDMKDSLAEVIIEHLRPVQEKLAELEGDPGHVDGVLKRGAERAREKAAATMEELRKLLGIQ